MTWNRACRGDLEERHWQDACAAALARLPGMGPAALVSILREHDPGRAWEMILGGALQRPTRSVNGEVPALFDAGGPAGAERAGGELLGREQAGRQAGGPARGRGGKDGSWASAASRMDVAAEWSRALERGVRVTWFGRSDYPEPLLTDPNPAGVLFWRGSLECLNRPRVAIVGTRNATPDGRAIAFELGRDLSLAGVCVVSGLALGIDGAAHQGALGGFAGGDSAGRPEAVGGQSSAQWGSSPGPPLGVAASGVDAPYPRQHAALWERVCETGAVLSETPPGQPAQAWRFPTRNRIIAGLSLMVVVVESHSGGGSLITAEAALERGVEVRAVPGPVRSPASTGSNQLLYDGPGPVRSAQDVLDALGVFLPGPAERDACGAGGSAGRRGHGGADEPVNSSERAVLEAVAWRPVSVGQVVERSGLTLGTVAMILDQLEARGLIGREGGWWVRVKLDDRRR